MEKRKLIINIVLNTFRFSEDRLKKDWIDDRIEKFMKFTLRSLKIQTNQDFMAYVLYDPLSEDYVKQSLEQYERLPDNIQFIKPVENQTATLIQGYDTLFLIRLDSDDAYHKSFIQQLHDYQPKESTEVIINQNGYLYDSINNRLVEIFYESPQYYTFVYQVPEYLAGKRYVLSGGHAGAIKLRHELIDKPNFLNIVHSSNVLKTPKHLGSKDIISDSDEVNRIVKEYLG
jgi:hypothetical protein